MDAQPTPIPYHRLGRWKRGRVREIDLTPRDLDYLFALFSCGALPTDALHALAAPTMAQRVTTDRAFLLKNPPNRYLVQPEAQERSRNANAARLVYGLSAKGALALADHGRIGLGDCALWTKLQGSCKPQQFDHDVATACVLASMQIGARDAGLRFISWRDILGRARCPAETREAANPLAIPYSAEDEKRAVVPDAIFGLEYAEGACFFALEIDRATEQQQEGELKHATIVRKLKSYRQAIRAEAHRARFGLPSLQVLIVTTSIVRMANMIGHLKAVAAQDGCGPAHPFLFKTLPQLARRSGGRPPLATRLLEDPWDRAGHPQVSLARI